MPPSIYTWVRVFSSSLYLSISLPFSLCLSHCGAPSLTLPLSSPPLSSICLSNGVAWRQAQSGDRAGGRRRRSGRWRLHWGRQESELGRPVDLQSASGGHPWVRPRGFKAGGGAGGSGRRPVRQVWGSGRVATNGRAAVSGAQMGFGGPAMGFVGLITDFLFLIH